ncbi:MAG: acyltransferase family protein [Chitinophagales bacterium]
MVKLASFKRITSTGKLIPEIDGLRFFAISGVVLFHLFGLIAAVSLESTGGSFHFDNIAKLFFRGQFGVQLFFVISGLVLGIPFFKMRFKREKDLNLRSFYLRRLTRIEPPYFIVMIVLFFANVYVAHALEFHEGSKSLLASLFYSHNFIYGRHVLPYLTAVAWSLEIEIQFYLLMPLLSLIFLIRENKLRRGLMVVLIILFTFLSDFAPLSFISLYDFIQYFLVGFLLADLYYHRSEIKKFKWAPVAGYFAFAGIWMFDPQNIHGIWLSIWHLLQLFFVFFFYYAVLFQNGFKWVKKDIIVVIGGMCYSIYLLHYTIISFAGKLLPAYSLTGNVFFDNIIYSIIILIIVLIISALFYIFIERPCMNKNWPKELMARIKNFKSNKPATN